MKARRSRKREMARLKERVRELEWELIERDILSQAREREVARPHPGVV